MLYCEWCSSSEIVKFYKVSDIVFKHEKMIAVLKNEIFQNSYLIAFAVIRLVIKELINLFL